MKGHGRFPLNVARTCAGEFRNTSCWRYLSADQSSPRVEFLPQILAQRVNFGRRTLELFFESMTAVEHLVGFLLERSNNVLKFIGAAGATNLSE